VAWVEFTGSLRLQQDTAPIGARLISFQFGSLIFIAFNDTDGIRSIKPLANLQYKT